MKRFLGRIVLAVGLLPGLLCGLSAQQAQESQAAPDNVAPPPENYVPLQYVPLYTPAPPGMDADHPYPEDVGPAVRKAAPDDSLPEVTPPLGFRAPTATPRTDNSQPGFAPVVSLPSASVRERQLVNPSGGLPRLYAPGFRLGPFDVRPDVSVQGTYNDNIYLVSKSIPRTTDYIISVTPRVEASYATGTIADPDATQFSLFYTPTMLEFLNTPGNSSLNQDVNASLGHRFTKLRAFISQSYSHVSGGIIQAGDLVDQDLYSTGLDLAYDVTPKVIAELSSSYGVSRYSLGVGSNDLNSTFFVNYEARPKLTVSIAPYSDYLTTQGSSNDQWAVGGLVRANYVYSDQTSFYAQFGGGERWYDKSPLVSQEWNYTLGMNWQADAKTTVNLNAARQTNGSALTVNSDNVSSSAGFSIVESLIYHVTASLAGSYNHADYFSTLNGAAQQTYDFFSISPALVYHPSIWSDLGVSYTYRQNFSNVKTSEFTNNQINVFSTLRF